MWIETINNPCGRIVGDCAIRAVAIALGTDWEDAYDLLADAGKKMCDVMNANSVISAVLRMHGFYRSAISDSCPDCYTAADFAYDNPNGVFVLGFGDHVATVIDGNIYDASDCSNSIPLYVWYRKDD